MTKRPAKLDAVEALAKAGSLQAHGLKTLAHVRRTWEARGAEERMRARLAAQGALHVLHLLGYEIRRTRPRKPAKAR